MKHFLYKITNQINGKIYIGAHSGSEDDQYFGSGKLLLAALKKHGRKNFIKEILQSFDDRESMFLREAEIVNQEFIDRPDVYNLVLGGSGGSIIQNRKPFIGKHTAETKQKISLSLRGNEVSDETRKKLSENNWSKRDPEAQRKHAAFAASKRTKWGTHSDHTKQKISASLTGISQVLVTCPHCGKEGGQRALKRWHFDKCKSRV